MNMLGNLALTMTTITPVIFIYAIVCLIDRAIMLGVMLTLVGVGFFLLFLAFVAIAPNSSLEKSSFSFTSAESANKESMSIILIYLIPLLRNPVANFDWIFPITTVTIIIAMAITGYNYHFNPLLNVLKWNFYKVGTKEGVSYILVTRKEIHNTLRTFTVGQLTPYTLIDLEK